MENLSENKSFFKNLIFIVAVSLCLFLLAGANKYFRSVKNDNLPSTITLSGQGEYLAVPDVASFSFSVEKESTTQKEAKDTGSAVVNTVIETLQKDFNLLDKDVKTISLSINPKYTPTAPCYGYICPPVSSKIDGYVFNQTLEIKIRDIDKAGDVFSKLTDLGVSNIYGPNLTLDDPQFAQEKAREDAINDAKAKAVTLSKQLGVKLKKIQSFSEDNMGGVYPMYATLGRGGDMMEKSVSPEIPAGENKYVSNVTITYEIK